MTARYQIQVLDPLFVANNVIIPVPFTTCNLPQAIPVLQGHLTLPLEFKDDEQTLKGCPMGFTLNFLRIVREYINRSQVPPRNGPNDIPVCGYMSRTFYRRPINEDMDNLENIYTQGLAALNNPGHTKPISSR